MTLDEVVALAEARSEQIAIAQFGVVRATADQQRARSEKLPQVNGSASYDRTLKSEFSGLFSGGTGAACDPFTLNPSASIDARVTEIERAIDCGAVGGGGFGGGDFSDLPFGQANTYRLNLSFSQTLYAGGRIDAQGRLAAVGRGLAETSLAATRAQLVLDATQSFYDAAFAERLVQIAEATLKQSEATLVQVELSYKAGRLPEFEWIRARVARDNLRPNVIRANANRTIAYLRLKQLLEIPAGRAITVASDLDDLQLAPPPRFASRLVSVTAAAVARTAADRTPVLQATSAVLAREAALQIARSQKRPYVSLNSALGKVAYASLPGFNDWRTNWTVGASVQIPLFNGGRLKADEAAAGADLDEARARQKLALELSEAETEATLAVLDAAGATWEASAGTVEQATRAYDIGAIRYREGISTQLELLDAQLALQQAQVNRAQAARDLQLARARVALLPELPLGVAAVDAGSSRASTGTSSSGGVR
jgi:outer membrane protein TolC